MPEGPRVRLSLGAFPEEFFDRLRAGENVWAPFYTLHKIMAGLFDQWTLGGNAQALEVLRGMAEWTCRWASPLDDAAMARVLEREYGGMNELLYSLAAATGEASYRELAHRFDHDRIFVPLAAGRDELRGLHVNTQIPKIIGAARRYETTGDPQARAVASYFWTEVTSRRSYATGGTSNEEEWRTDPGSLASELGGYTQECCCTYNMLKLTRHVFAWTADPACADYAERALFNGILGTQHPSDGAKLYYVPLGSGYWKYFGTPLADFWCCTGTGAESFAKLAENAYFHDADGLWVNLFLASELSWPAQGLVLTQDTRFPEDNVTRLKMRLERTAPVCAAAAGAGLGRERRGSRQRTAVPRPNRRRVPRPRADLVRRRPRGVDASHDAPRRAHAGRSDARGPDLGSGRPRRPPRPRGPHGGDPARRADEAANGARVRSAADRRAGARRPRGPPRRRPSGAPPATPSASRRRRAAEARSSSCP